MLEVVKDIRIRRNNTLIPVSKYKLTTLKLDLHSTKITIKVEFYKKDGSIFIKYYDFVGKEDVDVNELINQVHLFITNEG
jgi:hypothetical protein